jgi:hypothetical protein
MERMENILKEIVNSPFTVDELIVMFDDFTFDAEAVFYAIGMYMDTKELKEFNSQTDVTLTLVSG